MVESTIGKQMLPLEGIRVLDLGTMTPGKYCTFLLGDLGAEVIRVERPTAPSAAISDEDLVLNRNKRSIALNLRTEEGKQVFYQLVQSADVILEGNRPGVTRRMGVDYDTVKGINPNIIYCSLSGFGQDGPYHQFPGFDLIFMAIGGLLGLIGGRPPIVPGIYVSDVGSGLLATIGILTALLARQRTGKGQFVDVAMLDGVVSWLSTISGVQRLSGEPSQEMPGWVMPGYNVYETKDSKYLALGIFRPQSWQALCQTLGREDFIDQQWAMQFYDLRKEIVTRNGTTLALPAAFPVRTMGTGLQECKDGWVNLYPIGRMNELLEWMDSKGMAGDLMEPEWQEVVRRGGDAFAIAALMDDLEAFRRYIEEQVPHINELIRAFFKAHTMKEICEEGQKRRIPVLPCNTTKDLLEDPQLLALGFFVDIEHPELGATLRYPGAPYRLSETPWQIERRAPLIGEHNLEIYEKGLGFSREELRLLKEEGAI